MSTPAFDAVVVGAGIVGCATAYELARAGLSVALLDKGDIGGAVTGGSLACVGTHMISRDEIPLLMRSCQRWSGLENELDFDFEYNACGQMRFVRAPADLEVARGWLALEAGFGLEGALLDPAAVRGIAPALRGPVLAATWSPRDATVNPFLACRAFVEAAQRLGCRVHPGTGVTAIHTQAGRITGVTAGALRIATKYIVNAAGPWADAVARLAGCALPIAPRKAQCLATTAVAPIIPCVVGACESAGGVEAGYTQIQQAAHGQILFNTVLAGGVRTEARPEDDLAVDRQFVLDSVETLLWLFPDLRNVTLLRSWCAYEAVTPDDHFLIGPVDGVDGLLVAAGDGGTGFNRAPMIGEMIAQWASGNRAVPAMTPYLPSRFGTEARVAA